MNFRRKPGWKIMMLIIGMILLLLADDLNMTRVGVVAACMRTKEIFQSKTDGITVIQQNRHAIMNEAGNFDLPPELLAAILYDHQRDLTSFRKFTDCVGSALGGDFSLGPAQVRISTAIQSDGRRVSAITPREFKVYRAALLDPSLNIRCQAKELRSLIERKDRSPGITSAELMNRPPIMALLLSEYRTGRKGSPVNSTGFGAGSFGALRLFMNEEG